MELFKLLELQEIDKRMMELDSFKGDLPEQIENLKTQISALKEDLSKSKEELAAVKKLNRTMEMDIRSLTDKLNKYQEQIYTVKTNKEYDAITVEIENLEKKIEDAELMGVELLEKEDTYTTEVGQLEKQILDLHQFLQEKELELQEKLNQTETEQKILLANRNEIISTIDHRLLATYERIRKGRDGIAIAEIENYTCQACYATIPAQTVMEVRKMDKMINCEVCGRILFAINNHIEKPLEIKPVNIQRVE